MFVGRLERRLPRGAWALVLTGLWSSTGGPARAEEPNRPEREAAVSAEPADDALAVVDVQRAVSEAARQIEAG